jgi:hypothetical protein
MVSAFGVQHPDGRSVQPVLLLNPGMKGMGLVLLSA